MQSLHFVLCWSGTPDLTYIITGTKQTRSLITLRGSMSECSEMTTFPSLPMGATARYMSTGARVEMPNI